MGGIRTLRPAAVLTSPPDLMVDCDAELAAWRAAIGVRPDALHPNAVTSFVGNSFDAGTAVTVLTKPLRFEHNLVGSQASLWLWNTVASGNHLEADSRVVGEGDFRHNGWGAADGPSGVGPGSGPARSGDAPYAPWLVTPPDLSVDCDAEVAAWRGTPWV